MNKDPKDMTAVELFTEWLAPKDMTAVELLHELIGFKVVQLAYTHTEHVIDEARMQAIADEINRRFPTDGPSS